MEGQAFMFSPMGMIPIEQDGTPLERIAIDKTATNGGTVRPTIEAAESRVAPQQIPVQASLPLVAVPALKPRDVVKAAKTRAAEIRAQLRVMKRLEKELVELERLIAAAKQKPVALVRNIDHARHAR